MTHYMLDTNICIYIIKQKPREVLTHFERLNPDQVCISAVTLSELMYGVEKSQYPQKNHDALAQFILPLTVEPFGQEATRYYGDIRAGLEKKGQLIGPLDLMIAAHAKSLGATLVTNNTSEFMRVPALSLTNWIKFN